MDIYWHGQKTTTRFCSFKALSNISQWIFVLFFEKVQHLQCWKSLTTSILNDLGFLWLRSGLAACCVQFHVAKKCTVSYIREHLSPISSPTFGSYFLWVLFNLTMHLVASGTRLQKGHPRFPRDGTCQQRLARARRAAHHHTWWLFPTGHQHHHVGRCSLRSDWFETCHLKQAVLYFSVEMKKTEWKW